MTVNYFRVYRVKVCATASVIWCWVDDGS